ncbi:MarR family winged helix-turn-helix transcriptional regulator [Curvibacter lanceolatus]|uniref:MarR family winged helix-turn-helix transcriptional regulator n=1 Tax=Curvibacter lanceolatus TaxID=86182 RepID=UPI0023562795|nr:winged helix DNA-binding protein [Curvibacter lanceolatus]
MLHVPYRGPAPAVQDMLGVLQPDFGFLTNTMQVANGQTLSLQRDGLIQRQRDPQDARRTVVQATDKGLRLVETLSITIEAHYQWMEQTLGKDKLLQLYQLLDTLIELEQP